MLYFNTNVGATLKGIGAAGTDVPEGIRDDCDFVSEDSFGREICLDGFVVSKRKAKAGR